MDSESPSKWLLPEIKRPLFGSPYNKSPTILGSILGPLIFGISQINSYTTISPRDVVYNVI